MSEEDRRIYQGYVQEVLEERRLVRRIERFALIGMVVIAGVVVWLM